jgi:hypothetical protein
MAEKNSNIESTASNSGLPASVLRAVAQIASLRQATSHIRGTLCEIPTGQINTSVTLLIRTSVTLLIEIFM